MGIALQDHGIENKSTALAMVDEPSTFADLAMLTNSRTRTSLHYVTETCDDDAVEPYVLEQKCGGCNLHVTPFSPVV